MGKLTDELIARITNDGLYNDGNRLYLRKRGAKLTWFGKWVRNGKQTSLSYGPYPQVSIEDARAKAAGNRVMMDRLDKRPHVKSPIPLRDVDVEQWLSPRLLDMHAFACLFGLAGPGTVLQLVKLGKVAAVYVGRDLLIESESAWRWFHSLPKVQPDDVRIDLSELTPADIAALTELANDAMSDTPASPTQRLKACDVLDERPVVALAARHLDSFVGGTPPVAAARHPQAVPVNAERLREPRRLPLATLSHGTSLPPAEVKGPRTGKMRRFSSDI